MLLLRVLIGALFLISQVSFATTPAEQLVSDYAKLAYASYTQALAEATELDAALQSFVAQPTSSTMEEAKQAWREAKDAYSQTEVFRFYGGPIDGEGGPEGFINAWPLDEAYIDYVVGNPDAGIIADLTNYPQIKEEVLRSLNEKGGEKNVTTGYHAIEFLLWGQDMSLERAGQRSLTDYLTDPLSPRRADYLLAASSLLLKDLSLVQKQWILGESNYRESFVSDPAKESLTKVFTGVEMLLLDELSGERMYVALESASQEDEQSCFSDHTKSDLVFNLKAVANILKGEAAGVQTMGLIDLIATADQALAQDIATKLEVSIKAVAMIPAPFDLALTTEPGRAAITTAIDTLFDLGEAVEAGREKLLTQEKKSGE